MRRKTCFIGSGFEDRVPEDNRLRQLDAVLNCDKTRAVLAGHYSLSFVFSVSKWPRKATGEDTLTRPNVLASPRRNESQAMTKNKTDSLENVPKIFKLHRRAPPRRVIHDPAVPCCEKMDHKADYP